MDAECSQSREFGPTIEKSTYFNQRIRHFIPRPITAPSSPSGKRDGATHWRLRGAKIDPPHDAAGMLGGSRYHGRNTPLKGKGAPPADDHQVEYQAKLKKWSQERSHLLQTRDLLGQRGWRNVPEPSTRYTRVMTPNGMDVKSSKLQGASGMVLLEPPAYRKQRGAGVPVPALHVDSGTRVLCVGQYSPEEVDPGLQGRKVFGRRVGLAPPSPTEVMKAHYAAQNKDYRLDGSRMPSPQCEVKSSPELRHAYAASLGSFMRNKVAAHSGSFIFG